MEAADSMPAFSPLTTMADTWRQLTEADLQTVLDTDELTTFRERALGIANGADPVAALIAAATEEIRGRIRANRDNTLGPAGTLPGAVVARALVVIRHRVLTICRIAIPEHRQTEYNDAEQFFRDVARGLIAIDQPDTPADESAPTKARPSYTPSGRPNLHGI